LHNYACGIYISLNRMHVLITEKEFNLLGFFRIVCYILIFSNYLFLVEGFRLSAVLMQPETLGILQRALLCAHRLT
jgi:hypothetical protein